MATKTATPASSPMAELKLYLAEGSDAGEVTPAEWNELSAHDKVQLVRGWKGGDERTLTY